MGESVAMAPQVWKIHC